jgi:protein-S-isoprenylcysteine O-methyltransferase Ste14
MLLREDFVRSGRWLFRWRSYSPLLVIVLVLAGMSRYAYPQGSHTLDQFWVAFCLTVALLGLAIRVLVIGHVPEATSGRNSRTQVAAQLNTSGMYSVVRHPLYLGNFLMWLGPALFPHRWDLALLVICLFVLQYERIIFAEEEFLSATFGEAFERWAAVTPAFFPRLRQWQPPALPFSLRTVLRREYSGFFALIVIFTLLDAAADWQLHGRIMLDPLWAGLFLFGLCTYLVLRLIKRRTRLLMVSGR